MIKQNKEEIGCEKELMTSRTERDDAVLCGDTYNDELWLCLKCRKKQDMIKEIVLAKLKQMPDNLRLSIG